MDKNIEERIYEGMCSKGEGRANGIHVTSLTQKCLRKSVYDRATSFQMTNRQGAIRMWIGTGVHIPKLLQGDYEKSYIYPPDIVCSIDEYDKGTLLEKKTVTFPVKTSTEFNRYFKHYLTQAEYYKAILEHNGKQVDEVAFVLVNIHGDQYKKDPDIYTYSTCNTPPRKISIRSNDVVVREMEQRAGILRNAMETKVLPPRYVSTLCNYCPNFDRCFSSEDGEWDTKGVDSW